MSTHNSTLQHNNALEKDIKSLQFSFNQIVTSSTHYHTREIENEVRHINNALDNIKLDREFQRGSKNWAKQFDANDVKQNETNIKQLLAKGQSLTQELNTCLHTTTVQNKEENQIRELNSWACNTLHEYLQSLQPIASGSYARLDNIAHHLGVTDRYIGYRHNLTRSGNQPLNVHTIWADRKLPRSTTFNQQSTPDWKTWVHAYRHYGPSGAKSAAPNQHRTNDDDKLLGYLRPKHTSESKRSTAAENFYSKSCVYDSDYNNEVRKAGINQTFPGATEFMDRYKKPEELPYSPFTINPQPDYTLPGRPLARVIPDSFSSEYTRSYVFPDSTKLEKFPWLRSS
ncbi:unnamed protein product [Rotaria socialis]|uniref:Uncharacterized protein n=1 Tax=Rotaria socialis TaxID=392032 RepID=A0A817MR91_9BILA|nr:unnamed protein product [Rotaria socialis]CAF3333198.1 unnamed protein product [Rotaria socialis]CAF3631848.1 unnamed protein product [Rotaria socialis]CAF3648703.1 unnamed protein product [Rotaria socialis]CAF3652537.1 unnamed protein product [Rotaria socialis]